MSPLFHYCCKFLATICLFLVCSQDLFSQQADTTIIQSLSPQISSKDTIGSKEVPAILKRIFEGVITKDTKDSLNQYGDLEIDGLIFDQTKTKSGRDFYDIFFRDWVSPPEARNYFLFIEEKPFRLNTTLIEIYINETLVFQQFLQPRYDYVEELVPESILATQNYLVQYEQLVRDLGGSDQSGTGIY